MNGPGEATPTNVTYDILWVCCTNGMNEATEGRIEIASVLKGREIGGSSKAIGANRGAEAMHEDLISFTKDGSAETSDITSTTSEESSTQYIPCIAKLMWGSWEATFYGSYDPPSESYRSTKGVLFDFNFRGMNEWMETGLKGHTITQLGIDCPQRDDHGHEILVFHMVWEQSTLESRTARLFAKRELGKASLCLSGGEFRELGIPKQNSSNRLVKQPDSCTASSRPEYGVRDAENTVRKDRRVGRTGFSDGAGGVSRGNLRGKTRGQARRVKKPSHALTWGAWWRTK